MSANMVQRGAFYATRFGANAGQDQLPRMSVVDVPEKCFICAEYSLLGKRPDCLRYAGTPFQIVLDLPTI